VPPAADTAPALLTQTGASEGDNGSGDNRSVFHKPWFWAVVGGGVAIAAAAVLFVTLGGSKDPTASLGQAPGN
jgi:hypothetical protein